MLKNKELRKLPAGTLCNISAILETNNDWKKVMSLVPRNPRSEYFEPKYNNEHIKLIEEHAKLSNKKCADILFEEWGTSGRIRPTLSTLKDVVQKAGILRAADALADLLNEERPQRPSDGPGAPIDTGVTDIMNEFSTEHMPHGSTRKIGDQTNQNPSFGNKTTTVVRSNTNNLPDFSVMLGSEKSVYDGQMNGDGPAYQMSFPNVEVSIPGIATEILTNTRLIDFHYDFLEHITKKFSDHLIYIPEEPITKKLSDNPVTPDFFQGKLAGRIGSGGFGDVYVGYHPEHGHLAVKKIRSTKFDQKLEIALRVFNTEVRFLSKLSHTNIVPIIGFSKDGPALCVVCEYIDGGSLEQKIAAKILTERQRINIMIGTAEGLRYLHGYQKPETDDQKESHEDSKKNNFLHGDIKAANILLTRDCVPKLCDFGLARQYEKTYIVTHPMGTAPYMAPEGFMGSVTQKADVYSYGIVLLELLTGLKPLVENHDRETLNIKDYLEESCVTNEINTLLDPFIDKWTKGKEIYALAKRCLVRERLDRPTAKDICNVLYKISEDAVKEKEASNNEYKTPSPYQLLNPSSNPY